MKLDKGKGLISEIVIITGNGGYFDIRYFEIWWCGWCVYIFWCVTFLERNVVGDGFCEKLRAHLNVKLNAWGGFVIFLHVFWMLLGSFLRGTGFLELDFCWYFGDFFRCLIIVSIFYIKFFEYLLINRLISQLSGY